MLHFVPFKLGRTEGKIPLVLILRKRAEEIVPKGYRHFDQDSRCQLYIFKSSGMRQCEIAKRLGVSASSVSRELKRNAGGCNYFYKQAHSLSVARRREANARPTCLTAPNIVRIEQHLKEEWSPEQISGRLRCSGVSVSHESIYRHVWKDKREGGSLYLNLRRSGKKYNKRSAGKAGRGCIPNRVDIEHRPSVVEDKSRIGDWEGDTIIGAKHQGALLTYVDRKSKFTLITKLEEKKADQVREATLRRFSEFPDLVKTITYDNGKEFSKHESIGKQLGASCYFAKPYHSWERGLNEHTNGLIRQYLPKSTNLKLVSNDEIKRIERLINDRPRKVLNYRTPREVFLTAVNTMEKIALQC